MIKTNHPFSHPFSKSHISYSIIEFGIIAARSTKSIIQISSPHNTLIFLNKIDKLKMDMKFNRLLSHNQIKYLINESLIDIF